MLQYAQYNSLIWHNFTSNIVNLYAAKTQLNVIIWQSIMLAGSLLNNGYGENVINYSYRSLKPCLSIIVNLSALTLLFYHIKVNPIVVH
jgi:hypothetical protein